VSALKPFQLVHTRDQWYRCAFDNTTWFNGAIQLGWQDDVSEESLHDPVPPAGLAFDPWCRLYHTLPEQGQIERVHWAASATPSSDSPAAAHPATNLFEPVVVTEFGDFSSALPDDRTLQNPQAISVDQYGRLFVAETDAGRLLVFDLQDRRLMREVRLNSTAAVVTRPLDIASNGSLTFALLDSPVSLIGLDSRSGPWDLSVVSADTHEPVEFAPFGVPSRLAVHPDGHLFVLFDAGTRDAKVVPLWKQTGRRFEVNPGDLLPAEFASDLEFMPAEPSGTWQLVVSRRPGEDFLRWKVTPQSHETQPPLKARYFDGRAIVRTPDGRIAFWTPRGFRHAVTARLRYREQGTVTTFRLDSGEFQTTWGRLFLDACIPRGTEVRIHAVAADEPPEKEVALDRSPPLHSDWKPPHEELSPPMPPVSLVPGLEDTRPIYRRENGRELPWIKRVADGGFQSFEAPVQSTPGRYLWVTIALRGHTFTTPRVKSLRVEQAGHGLLRRLPRFYSEDPGAADFLQRYLALFDGFLSQIDSQAFARRALLDPRSAPPEVLGWLSGFVGLLLDERWPEETKRTLIEEAISLFRWRGTLRGLIRFLEIYLGRTPILIEHFRVRGHGGAIVGPRDQAISRPILGAGFRVGGQVSTDSGSAASADELPPPDAFATHAHRFSVVMPVTLNNEQLDVVEHILEVHRPAHTLVDICAVESGMRIGVALYVELNSIVGHTSGFGRIRVGGVPLGRSSVLGTPRAGTRPGSSQLGLDSRIG